MKQFTKKLLSIALVFCVITGSIAVKYVPVQAADARVEQAIAWAVAIANDDSHGYSQLGTRRWGEPDYDCATYVITAFANAGFDVEEASNTGNMRSVFEKAGFVWIPKSDIYLEDSSQLQRGDILLNEVNHTEIYIGDNVRIGAHFGYVDKYDTNYPGDQTGNEIGTYNYSNSNNWDGVLRYGGGNNTPIGSFDTVEVKEGCIHVIGWAYDPDETSKAINVHVYVGGQVGTSGAECWTQDINGKTLTANCIRLDVDAVYGCGQYHGFDYYVPTTKTGNQPIYIYAIDTAGGTNPEIGGKTATLKSSFKVTYNANGGTGVPATQSKTYNKNLTLSTTVPKRTGYDFVGWGRETTSAVYKSGEVYTGNANLSLYAVWKKQDISNAYIPKVFEYNGNIYAVYNEAIGWEDANKLCKTFRGHLVTINDANENEEIRKNIQSQLGNGIKKYYIGLNDIAKEKTYVWADGSSSSYRNYYSGQPSDTSGKEDYFTMLSNGQWADESWYCTESGFILEIEKASFTLGKTLEYNGNVYEFYSSAFPYSVAEFYAEQKGGHLVVMDSAEENSFVNENKYGGTWLGIKDTVNGTDFKTYDGKELVYTKWGPDEPKNNNNVEFYGVMYTGGSQWRSIYNGIPEYFVIEYESEIIKGDVNGDTFVNNADAELLLKLISSNETISDAVAKRSEMNNDRSLDLLDVIEILNKSK